MWCFGCRGVGCSDLRSANKPASPGVICARPAKMLAGSILGQARAMDGAGRLARSLRSLGPQADLKAAAIGAVVLLREYLGLPARKKKTPIDRAPPSRIISWLERCL